MTTSPKLTCFFLVLFCASSFVIRQLNVHSWKINYNESTILKGHGTRMDTLLLFESKYFKTEDSIKFYYNFDVMGGYNYLTKIFLTPPGQKGILVSKEITENYLYGKFPLTRLKQIYDSCNCEYLEFQYLIANKDKKATPRSIAKLRVMD